MKHLLLILLLCASLVVNAQSHFEVEATTWTSRYKNELSGAFKDETSKMTLKMNGSMFSLFGGPKQVLVFAGKLDKEARYREGKNSFYEIKNFKDAAPVTGSIDVRTKNGTVVITITDQNMETIVISLLNPVFKQ